MIKTSILARKLDFASMGDLRDDIVADIERLEAIEETFLAINKECEKADGPSIYFGGNEIGCEIEWAIYGTGGDMWLCPARCGDKYSWRTEVYNAKRWEARNGAQSYINIHKIDAAIPFPVPKLKEAK